MRYELLGVDGTHTPRPEVLAKLQPLIAARRVVRFGIAPAGESFPLAGNAAALLKIIDRVRAPEITLACTTEALRVRIVEKCGRRILMLFNESLSHSITVTVGLGTSTSSTPPVAAHSVKHSLTLVPASSIGSNSPPVPQSTAK